MELGMQLVQQQALKLAMTQEMRQAITLLQLTAPELKEYLQQQELENPMMELKEKSSPRTGSGSREAEFLDFQAAPEATLQEELASQLRMMSLEASLLRQCLLVVEMVDDNGYLTPGTPPDWEEEKWESAVAGVQQLEPAGVGARSLRECLQLQLERHFPEEAGARLIASDYLEALAEAATPEELAERSGLSVSASARAAGIIQQLQPKPGAAYGSSRAEYILPEVYIEPSENGWDVFLNDTALPEMYVSREYQLIEQEADGDAKAYLKRKREQFEWIKSCVQRRQETLLQVTKELVRRQERMLSEGADQAVPLTLKMVAEALHIHESTVSRATVKKYAQTPKGILELKSFFHSGLKSGHTVHSVKKRIIEEIEAENRGKPLSDDKMASRLHAEGIAVSRRTVAKYRTEAGIPSSSARKKQRR
ncbi:RNA polymerase factor sigma-54 [Alkalicoccus urumqiensis]|uniref:RNA polymerase sigma-54 factor n=1 Tax=Alkalicoccus urumqiensis TaxID=1548213 RepID=A0A2P6MH10_ALKUR|nr:RNA polymerase factor sigma-54 [Alkalicoccus urumqiensis]PRO65576.1 RNA polymerase sigma-54 factor [Alkalicoccus urumqiensis]